MNHPTPSPPRILIVEYDEEIGDVLTLVLEEEGYEARAVPSVDQAFKLLDEQVFHLILCDLPINRPADPFQKALLLCQRGGPAPTGVLTTQNIPPEAAAAHGFAFLLRKPFELEPFLALVAATLNSPLSQEQQRQAQVALRFLEALNADTWDTLEHLSTSDLTAYVPEDGLFSPSKKIEGLRAYHALIKATRRMLPDCHIEEVLIAARPKGLAARYLLRWTAPDGTPQQQAAATLFHFQGERIHQVGVYTNTERLIALREKARVGR